MKPRNMFSLALITELVSSIFFKIIRFDRTQNNITENWKDNFSQYGFTFIQLNKLCRKKNFLQSDLLY